jgi:hypothetical protein
VDFALTNREGFYGVVILLALASQLLWPSAWPERVRELGYAKNAFVVETLPLFLRHAG